MTREGILAMKPGRELDALIAEKVLGWTVFRGTTPNHYDLVDDEEYAHGFPPEEDIKGLPYEIEEYSTRISEAWVIVPQIIGFQLQRRQTGTYTVRRNKTVNGYNRWDCVECSTAPEAICKAALLALLEVTP